VSLAEQVTVVSPKPNVLTDVKSHYSKHARVHREPPY
jgi:hypothetical protein